MLLRFFRKKQTENRSSDQKTRLAIPSASDYYDRYSFQSIEKRFRDAGFRKITCIPLNDLKAGILYRPFMVEKVTIDGQPAREWKYYEPEASVTIYYHSFPKEKRKNSKRM